MEVIEDLRRLTAGGFMFQLWAGLCEAAKQPWLKLEKKGLLAAGWTANAGFSDDIWSLDLNTF